VTYKEIAQSLGISPAALSLALNNKPGFSVATRERVFQKVKEMGYEHVIE